MPPLVFTRRVAALRLLCPATLLVAMASCVRPTVPSPERPRSSLTERVPVAPVPSEEGYWADLADPALSLYRRLLERSKIQLEELLTRGVGPRSRPRIGEVIDALELAGRVRPAGWEAPYWLGVALYHADRSRPAVVAFERARKLGGDQAADDIAFKMGVALSKLGEFERAVREYERSLAFSFDSYSRAVVESNCAEALMGMGRLDESIRRYQRASELHRGTSLPLWGLGVALDRSDQPTRARDAIRRALAIDPSMQELTSDNVFFVPAGDAHYYRAFGLEILGRPEESADHWQRFLAALPASPWAARARQHLEEIRRLPPQPRIRRQLNIEVTHILSGDRGRGARKLVERHREKLTRCFEQLPARLTPRLHVRLTYTSSSRPLEVDVTPPSVAYGVGPCVRKVVQSWTLVRKSTLWLSIEVLGVRGGAPRPGGT